MVRVRIIIHHKRNVLSKGDANRMQTRRGGEARAAVEVEGAQAGAVRGKLQQGAIGEVLARAQIDAR